MKIIKIVYNYRLSIVWDRLTAHENERFTIDFLSIYLFVYFICFLYVWFRPKSALPSPPPPPTSEHATGPPVKYKVVVCGASGHNIRNQPTFKATPVGMLVQGNVVSAVDRVTNGEGVWIKLSDESSVAHCGVSCATAWSLAADTSHVVYLKPENDQSESFHLRYRCLQ